MDDWNKRNIFEIGRIKTDPINPMISPELPPTGYGPHEKSWIVDRTEFESLKQEVEELKKLLKAAKAYDEATGQPNCEMRERKRWC
jgi:hypothetical protein